MFFKPIHILGIFFFFVDASSNSIKITKLLIQSISNCKWITACVTTTMSILNNKRTLIVCQLLLSTLAFGLFQVGRLSTWNIAITYMTDSIICVFILSYFRCLGYIQLLRLVVILSYLAMPVNLVQYKGAAGVFNNHKFHNKTVANKFYSSQCGFNAELAVLAPFSIHQIILLLLTTLM